MKKQPELVLPNIPIRIHKMGKKLYLETDDYLLKLTEMDKKETYSLLLLDKFISEVAMKELKLYLDNQQNRQAAKKSLDLLKLPSDDEAVDEVIHKIHDDMFGEK